MPVRAPIRKSGCAPRAWSPSRSTASSPLTIFTGWRRRDSRLRMIWLKTAPIRWPSMADMPLTDGTRTSCRRQSSRRQSAAVHGGSGTSGTAQTGSRRRSAAGPMTEAEGGGTGALAPRQLRNMSSPHLPRRLFQESRASSSSCPGASINAGGLGVGIKSTSMKCGATRPSGPPTFI